MIAELEQKLFDKWAKTRQGFSPDGIVDEQLYLASKPKILLVLKEVNSKTDTPVDLKDFLKNGAYGRRPTWDNVARWIYGIRNLDKEIDWSQLDEGNFLTEIRKELLPTICVINVKKSPGGHTTDNSHLWTIAENDKDLLKEQFDLYYNNPKTRPDLIICGGSATSDTFNALVDIPDKTDWKKTSRGIYYFGFDNGRYLIKYTHPEARVQDSILHYGLMDAIREIKTKGANVQ
jgi:hypothetical protein